MSIDVSKINSYSEQFGINEDEVIRIAVDEAFIRRAALVDGPFMLKGSHVTRQYLREGWRRIPADLDWVGLGALDAKELTKWVTAVTEVELDDGIRFRSFSENAFWRKIDYAMDDDFPTVNTDLLAWVGEAPIEIAAMDVSFGLKLQPPPRRLAYRPLFGEAFDVPRSCALELQIAWKLHQCLARPRFKDLLDLILLLRDNAVDSALIWHALEDECRHDGTPIARFNWLLDCAIGLHPHWRSMQSAAHSAEEYFPTWRNTGVGKRPVYWVESELAVIYIEGNDLPRDFANFLAELADRLKGAGFVHLVLDGPAAASGPPPTKENAAAPVEQAKPKGIGRVLRRWIGRG
ncbi:MAG: nucleotidyl transferase AbiEii/AbiGii toxin family protein [Pseudomonadota bacterium]